jgi:hypothetical protein
MNLDTEVMLTLYDPLEESDFTYGSFAYLTIA